MTAYATIADLRAYLPQVPEFGQQLITPTAFPFTLTYEGVATGALPSGATATTVQTALRGIAAIGSGGVNVRGRPGGPYTATFQGPLATDAAPLIGSSATITPATDGVLQSCLDRASAIVRGAIRAALGDPLFDYAAWGVASTRIVRGIDGATLGLPPHQLGSITAVAYQSGTAPLTYAPFDSSEWSEDGSGSLYRAAGWASYGSGSIFGGGNIWGDWGGGVARDGPRYQITAIWGYGPDVPPSIAELTIELAVNIWRSRDKGGFSELVGAEGPGAIRAVAGLNKLQQQIIDDYTQPLREIAL